MKHTLKTAFNFFVKLVIARFFGFILSSTILLALSGVVGSVATQLCSAIIFVVICFSAALEQGAKDRNMINIGHCKEDNWLGLKAGLAAAIPEIAMSACLLLTKAGVINEHFPVLFNLYNGSFLPFQQALISPTMTVAENPWFAYILTALTALIGPMCFGFGYRLGLLQIPLSDTLLYTTPEARERHEQRLKERRKKNKRRLF